MQNFICVRLVGAQTSGKINHFNGAGGQAGTVPEQSGQNKKDLEEREASPAR